MTDVTAAENPGRKAKGGKRKQGKTKEGAREKFLRLTPPRMEAALKKISLIGNLSGSGYQYEPGEAKEIIEALTDAVEEVSNKFNKSGKRGGKGFAFRSRK